MKLRILVAWIIALAAPALADDPLRYGFDDQPAGAPPAGWVSGVTGRGAADWRVIADTTAPSHPHALRQSGVGTFPWTVLSGPQLEAGRVAVAFKAVAGREDQAAGLVWRFRDGDHYYVARANALEDNVVAYRVVGGRRSDIKPRGAGPLAYGVRATLTRDAWHTLAVEFSGTQFSVWLDGRKLFDAADDALTGPGLVGLWTKADSVTLFDDFTLTAQPPRPASGP